MRLVTKKKFGFGVSVVLTILLLAWSVGCSGDDKEHTENDEREEQTVADEVHQLCAAAGQTEEGDLTALHCLGPQDPSGKTSESGDLQWEPGAFHIVSQ